MTSVGYTTDHVRKSEILEISEKTKFQCSDWVDYPMDVWGATGGLVGSIPIICGGRTCYNITANKAVLLGKMTSMRQSAASVVINNKLLWVTGGYQSSTDFIHLNGTISKGNSGCRRSKMTKPTLRVLISKNG